MAKIVDSYSEANYDQGYGSGKGLVGQSFTGDGETLHSVVLYMRNNASVTGDAYVKIYAHSGAYGTSSIPTGSVLATSDAVDVSTISSDLVLVTFTFSGDDKIVLGNGTYYCLVGDVSGTSSPGSINFGVDASSPTHGGNFFSWPTFEWVADPTRDVCFYVYNDLADPPTILTSKPTLIRTSVATFKGNIVSTGGENPTTVGFEYGKTESADNEATNTGHFSTGDFDLIVKNLKVNTTYNTRAFATNSAGTGYGSWVSFTTLDTTYPVQKRYIYKVYDSGDLVDVWSDDVLSEPYFTTEINGGPGELKIVLKRDFDNFGEDVDVKFNNKVDVICFDIDNPDGLLVYRGYVSSYSPSLEEGRESVVVTVFPFALEASRYMLRNSNGDTEIVYSSKDPGTIFADVLSKIQADGSNLNSTASSIETTGTTVTYTFNTNNAKQAFDKVVELSPEGWYWSVDPDTTVNFKEKPSTVTHDLIIGEHIKSAQIEKRIEDTVNRVYFTGGGSPPLYRTYERASSVSTLGLYAKKLVDQRVTVTDTAQTMSTRVLDDFDESETRIRMQVLDNNGNTDDHGYDIESIKVGDTVRIKNLQFGTKSASLWDQAEWDVDVWDQTLASVSGSALLVVKTRYSANVLEIETSSRFPVVTKRIEDINRNLEDSQTFNNPTKPN